MRGSGPDGSPARRTRDALAIGVVAAYALLALLTQAGASAVGQGLDPVWAGARQRGVLRVAVDFGYAPFADMREGVPAGFDIDLSRAIAAKLGLDVEFVASGLDSIYDDLASGRADMAASALPYAPEQGWRATFSTFYFNAGQVLLVPEGSGIAGEADLSGRRLGAALGTDADTYARRLVAADQTIDLRPQYESASDTLAALRRGQLDAAIVDNAAALTELNRAPGLRLAAALTLEPYALAFPARAFTLHDRANAALEELRREGFFEELGRRWFRAE